MKKTVVIDIVGLSKSVIGDYTPFLKKYIAENALTLIEPPFPAVTTTSQSCFLTGKRPESHGIVGNGWYDRQACEVRFWKQSNRLVEAEKLWEAARRQNPAFTCSQMFWWYNMYAAVDFSATPRPQYHSDGVEQGWTCGVCVGLSGREKKEVATVVKFGDFVNKHKHTHEGTGARKLQTNCKIFTDCRL